MIRIENRGLPLHRFGDASLLRLLAARPPPTDNSTLSTPVGFQYCGGDADRAFIPRIKINQLRDKFVIRHVDYILSIFGP